MNSRLVLSFLLLITFYHSASALVVGSLNSVSVESLVTFPSADTDNAMVGFGWIKNGFALEDMATTCSFDNVFPVSGSVALNGGLLRLYQDIIFKNFTTLQSLGSILGNGHVMHLCSSINAFPSEDALFDAVLLYCHADLDIVSTVTFQGSATICGTGNVLTLKNDAALVIDSDSSLELRDLEIRGISGSNIRCVDDTGRLILDNIRWIQDADTTFAAGSLRWRNEIRMEGPFVFAYESMQTSTILSDSQLHLSAGFTFSYDTDASNLLTFKDNTSQLVLAGATLHATSMGLVLTRGKLRVIENSAFSSEILQPGNIDNAITIGSSAQADDMEVIILPNLELACTQGSIKYRSVANDALKMTLLWSLILILRWS